MIDSTAAAPSVGGTRPFRGTLPRPAMACHAKKGTPEAPASRRANIAQHGPQLVPGICDSFDGRRWNEDRDSQDRGNHSLMGSQGDG
ncbi:uncharacterized protein CTHT_0052490 [Thermochaetoides thermophila DSM 1495]|uniref:Uncharacterized protein n=1 Tax=Chaetomium thermophilum (strain DSM 1495 / CBS 144.50 / IMI 039719) TaxID=759272 RepID=G0SDP3_CHATD|nr:hypothetical protein CTHT_0052490 [Thermochaetoides thermophila DSM 1495]EGS18644.1 hypothetical protein CTHT_0052490 [Thermochaetoides thermophila DSM 1495]